MAASGHRAIGALLPVESHPEYGPISSHSMWSRGRSGRVKLEHEGLGLGETLLTLRETPRETRYRPYASESLG